MAQDASRQPNFSEANRAYVHQNTPSEHRETDSKTEIERARRRKRRRSWRRRMGGNHMPSLHIRFSSLGSTFF